jgi:hypothetical protein
MAAFRHQVCDHASLAPLIKPDVAVLVHLIYQEMLHLGSFDPVLDPENVADHPELFFPFYWGWGGGRVRYQTSCGACMDDQHLLHGQGN